MLSFHLQYLLKTIRFNPNVSSHFINFFDMSKGIHIVFVNMLLLTVHCDHIISKRALLFPRPSFLQFTFGLTVPLVLPRRSINLSMCAQNNYNLPYNLAGLTPMIVPARNYDGLFGLTRRKFYEYIIKYLDSFGLEGEDCLLRSICEIAESPMHIKDEDTLLEKIVHFVFTPSLEMYPEVNNLTRHDNLGFDEKLLLAERVGKEQGKCNKQYSDCLVSIVDIFSTKYVI